MCCQMLLEFAFDTPGTELVLSVENKQNHASHKVMQRLGIQLRGIETHYDAQLTTYVSNRDDFSARDQGKGFIT